ncbi:ion channel [Marinicella meishanensis]|uniref:ion channel n=1 Tax=Marinicella meishanensis TaxID=2873263 RepID=UPI001CBA7B10|nr:ion channel [Marinicella sp. NBU2979]
MAVLYTILIHVIEIVLWAWAYWRLGEFNDISLAIYFSTVTATTLGYGDLTLSAEHQLLSGFEAIGGLILFGVSTAFFIKLIGIFFTERGAHNRFN